MPQSQEENQFDNIFVGNILLQFLIYQNTAIIVPRLYLMSDITSRSILAL